MKLKLMMLGIGLLAIMGSCKKDNPRRSTASCALQHSDCGYVIYCRQPDYDLKDYAKKIVGNWYWYKSTRPDCQEACNETPASTGQREVLEFKADGTLNRYEDCKLVKSMRYSLDNIGASSDIHLFIQESPMENLVDQGHLEIMSTTCMYYGRGYEAVGKDRFYSRQDCTCPKELPE